ncbi:MAG: NUDIX domain-containing protein [Minisyncoccota bacterium]
MTVEKTLKAGAIILSATDKHKVALLHRGKQNDWSFPKGHIDLGEDATEAMIREIREETGLSVKILKELPTMEYPHATEGIVSTRMFLVESEDDSQLKKEFENDTIEWILSDQVITKLSYNNLKEYFSSIKDKIITAE